MNNDHRVEKQPATTSDQSNKDKKRRRGDGKTRASEPQIGRALRSVYDQTVGEAVPAEMLELLGKLG